MTTVIHNNPDSKDAHTHEEQGTGAGFLLGIVMLVILAALFLVYGLPYVRTSLKNGNGTQINVPERVQVDINQQSPNQ